VYIIREFQPKDTFAVIKLASLTLTEQYNTSLFNYFYETFPQGFLVAEYAQKIIGFLVGVKIDTEKAKILMLSISKPFRRKKIGTGLINLFIKKIKKEKIKRIELEVRTDNSKAIQFYQKHDFKVINKLSKFYQNGKNAYTMERII
jgi:ribosomal-protein-alanine N-acetyltransferase